MKEITITIPGPPIAKKRPRFARRGNFVQTYNDQQTEEGRALWEIKNQINGMALLEGPLSVIFTFGMPIPSSMSKRKRELCLCDELKHVKKPDQDNLQKFYKDILNGVVWRDDSQVVEAYARKRYAAEPVTIITIREL